MIKLNEPNMDPTSFSLLASLAIKVAVEAMEVEEEAAQDDLLSLRSKEPLRFSDDELEILSLA